MAHLLGTSSQTGAPGVLGVHTDPAHPCPQPARGSRVPAKNMDRIYSRSFETINTNFGSTLFYLTIMKFGCRHKLLSGVFKRDLEELRSRSRACLELLVASVTMAELEARRQVRVRGPPLQSLVSSTPAQKNAHDASGVSALRRQLSP